MPTKTGSDSSQGTGPANGLSFRMLGFPISVPWSGLLGIVVIAVLWFPQFAGTYGSTLSWALAAVFAVLLTGSILLHELAHAISARAFGYPVSEVTLWALGGYTVFQTDGRHRPLREAVIAIAGPATTLLVAAVSLFLSRIPSPDSATARILAALAMANLFIGVFNLFPGSPLDGGAVVKALVWGVSGSETRGQLTAGWIGRGLAAALAASPLLLALWTGSRPSITLIVISLLLAAMLWSGATDSIKQARLDQALQLGRAVDMSRPLITVPSGAGLDSVLPQLAQDVHVVAVDDEGRPQGVVMPEAAAAVPQSERGRIPILAVCTRVSQIPAVSEEDSAATALDAAEEHDARFVAVLVDGRPTRLIDTETAFSGEDIGSPAGSHGGPTNSNGPGGGGR